MRFDVKFFQWCLSLAALPMANASQMEGRLRAMLNSERSRRAVARRAAAVTLMLAAGVLIPLAALRPAPHLRPLRVGAFAAPLAPSATPVLKYDTLPTDARWTRKLGGDLSVELVGVTGDVSKTLLSWRPDGSRLAEPLYGPHSGNLLPQYPNKERVREFALRLTHPSTAAVETKGEVSGGGTTSIPSGRAYNNGVQITDEREFSRETGGFRVLSAVVPRTLTRATIRVGIADGPWDWNAACRPGGSSSYSVTNRDGSEDEILFGKPYPSGSGHVLTVSDTYMKRDYRIIAVGVNGRVYDLHNTQGQNGQKFRVTTATFDVPLKQIKEFRFQTRPYRWVEFRDVPLQPGSGPGSRR